MIFGNQGLEVRYVLKEDLQWDINIDLVGHRMGHVFVDRTPENLEDELAPIRELGQRIDDDSTGVIFPEGTFFSEKRKARAVASLRKINDHHADIAAELQYLLPPRPAGTLALFEGAPDADIIMFGHVGFEAFGTIGDILDNLGTNQAIVLRALGGSRVKKSLRTPKARLIGCSSDGPRWIDGSRQISQFRGSRGHPHDPLSSLAG